MQKISAFIIAKNEEARISAAINSLQAIAEEVLVIDSGSSDDTVKIAEKLGAKVLFNEWPGYVKQKAYGENLCKNDWILNLDADEELSLQLQDEIKALQFDDYHAYRLNIVILHRKDKKPRLLAPRNKVIRLYDRRFCSFANTINTTTHDSVLFNQGVNPIGKIFDLKAPCYHRSEASIEHLVAKGNFYSTEQAKDLIKLNRQVSRTRIISELFFRFFKAYFLRRYFVFGFDGLVYSIIFAFNRFLRFAKAREIKENEQRKI